MCVCIERERERDRVGAHRDGKREGTRRERERKREIERQRETEREGERWSEIEGGERDMNAACTLLKEAPQQKSARELEISQHLKKKIKKKD